LAVPIEVEVPEVSPVVSNKEEPRRDAQPKSSLGRPARSLLGCQIVLLLKQTHRRDEKAGALPWHGPARTAEGGGRPGPGDPAVRDRCNPIHGHTCTSILLA